MCGAAERARKLPKPKFRLASKTQFHAVSVPGKHQAVLYDASRLSYAL